MDLKDKSKEELLNDLLKLNAEFNSLKVAFNQCKSDNNQGELKFKNIIESISDVVYEIDEKGIIKYISPSIEKLLAYKPEEIIGKEYIHFVGGSKDTLAKRLNELSHSLELENDYEIFTKYGDKCWVRLSTNALFVNGDFKGGTGIITKITEKKFIEIELQKSEALYKSIINASPDVITITDLEGKVILFSPKALEMFGYDNSDTFLNRSLFDFIDNRDKERALNNIQSMFNDSFLGAEEYRAIKSDGSTFYIEVNGDFIKNENGQPENIIFVTRDLTNRKIIEERLQKSEALSQSILDSSPDGIVTADLNGKLLTASPAILNMLGYTAENEVIGRSFFEFINQKEHEKVKLNLVRMYNDEITGSIEYEGIKADGTPLYVDIRGGFIKDNNGVRKNIILVVRDISEKKATEEKIEKSEEKYRNLIESINEIIYEVDGDGVVVFISPVVEKKYGYKQSEIIGRKVFDFIYFEDRPKILNAFSNLHIKDYNYLEYRYVLKNGETCWVRSSTTPVFKDGKLISGKGSIIDINDLKLAQLALADSEEKYSKAFNMSSYAILITQVDDGKFVEVNPAFTQISGYTRAEAMANSAIGLKLWANIEDRNKMVSILKSGKDVRNYECEFKNKNGDIIFGSMSASIIYFNEMPNILTSINDISVQKKAEKELFNLNANLEQKIKERTAQLAETNESLYKEIEERKIAENALLIKSNELEEFFSVSLDLLSVIDINGHFIKLNNSWENTLGFSVSELEGENFIEFVHPDDIEHTLNAMVELSDQKPVFEFVNRYRTKDGSYRVMEWHSVPIGDIIYSAARDITERKRAEYFENELLQLSTKLTGIQSSETDAALNLSLMRIGQFLKADRSYIFEFNELQPTTSNTFEWCNDGIAPEIENLQNIPCEALPMWMDALNRRENIIITDVSKLPEEWAAEREILEGQNIKSVIVTPILIENKLIGFVGLDNVIENKKYNTSEINILKVWNSLLTSIIKSKRADKILEQTRQNYETFFNTIDDFLWVLDENGNIIHANTTVKVRLEYPISELENQSVLMVHPPERRDEAARIVGEMLQGTAAFCPVPIVTKSGKYIPVETRVKAGFWNDKPVIFGVSKDVTQIQLSEQKFSSAFQSNSSMMAISNYHTGEFIDVNDEFLGKFGYSREEIIEKKSIDLNLFTNNKIRYDVLEKLDQNISIKNIELEFAKKNGEKILGLFSAEIIKVGNDICLLTSLIDITERKKSEIDLQKARIEAEQANLAKSEFLSRMSHELRTPMNSILGFAQILQMGDLSLKQSKSVEHILNSGTHLLDLINEVLDISRIEAGQLSISLSPIKLDSIIMETLDLVRPQLNDKQITIELVNSPNLFFVKSDQQRLKQVLLNLIVNAIKYNKVGGLITINTEINSNNNDFVRVSISDTGYGISSVNLSKLFIPFERMGAEHTNEEGTGLGLAVVKKLIDAMGGNIGVESVVDVGSTFWIEFPKWNIQPEVLDNSLLFGEIASNQEVKSGTILYIEDNNSNIELVEQILHYKRSQIQLISNVYGKNAFKLAVENNPDLILLDLDLPDISGEKVLKQLLSNNLTMSIPIVIISANAMPNQVAKMLKTGAKEYLTKPLDVAAFIKVVDRFIL